MAAVSEGVIAIGAWTAVTMSMLFAILWYFKLLRCSPEVEEEGLDKSKHGGRAYNWDNENEGDRPRDSSAVQNSVHQVVTVGENTKASAVVPFNED